MVGRRLRLRRVALVSAATILLVAAGGICTAIRRPLPSRSGEIRLPGLAAPAEARFDEIGIPHVRAATSEDAYRVLGWLHASDRLFQMEARRRAAAGRLAEIAGAGAVAADLEARRLGHDRLGRAEWKEASPSQRRELEAYAEGVSAAIASRPRPIELVALGVEPEPWTPFDSLRFLRLMAWTLTDAPAFEELRYESALRHGVGPVVHVLDPVHEAPTVVPDAPPYRTVAPALATDRGVAPRGSGSNAWVLAGSRTASGLPILANDPHLPPEMPGVWYAAHVTTDDGLDVAGLTLAGWPGVVIGHNGLVAWGFTMHQADDADLFLERLDEAGLRYLDGGRWRPLDARTERVRVRGEGERALSVLETRHGPLLVRAEESGEARIAPALSWAPATERIGFEAFDHAARARSGNEIEAAWARYLGPAVNVCWAAADGRIGVLAAGAIPHRRAGDGRLPVPGWTGEYDWGGLLPANALPRVTDPPEGFVASANDDWSAAGFGLRHAGHFAGRERVDRIRQALANLRGARVEDARRLQGDVLSPYAEQVVRALRTVPLDDPVARRAREALASWDGRIEKLGPSRLFHEFARELRERAFGRRERRVGSRLPVGWDLLLLMIEGTGGTDLWDDPGTAEEETRTGLLALSLRSALERVEVEEGRDPSRWRWGRVHTLTYEHVLGRGASLPGLGRLLDVGPIELPGDLHTVNVAGYSLASGRFDVRHIPSARIVVDLGDLDASRIVLPLGQSGQLGDPHVTDQLRAWSEGRDFPFPFTRPAVDRATRSTLRFGRGQFLAYEPKARDAGP